MSPDYEYYYKPALSAAEKRLKQLRKTTSSQWKLVHNDDISVYSNVEAPSNYKATKQLNAAIDLEVLYTVLSTVNLRTQWCQLFKDIIVTETPQPNINIIQASKQYQQSILWAERTEKKVNHVTYIANSFSTPSCTTNEDFFMACEVESRFDMAHVTLYCQFEQVTPEALSLFVNNLLSIRLFGWINYYDHDIEITQTNITKDTLQLEYQFKKENKEQYSKSQPVNIHSARHHTNATTSMTTTTQRRFQSGSWDQESITKPIYQHYLDKNASNSHLASSSLSYQHKGYMEEEQETITPEKEVRIQVMDHPNLTLLLPDNPEESNRFAQMCLNYYCRKEKGYTIQLIHPIQFMQYFTESNKMPYFRVHLTIGKSKDQKCYVNNNNWPVRPSLLLKMEHEKQEEGITATDDEEGEEDNDNDDQDEDIFVDGMESFQPQINTQNEAPALNPSQSTPAPSATPVTPLTTANITATTTTTSTSTSTTITTVPPETSDSKSEKTEIQPEENKHEITIPDSDPLALRQIYPRFVEYIQTPPQSILQHPTQENGNISISRIDVPNHPLGALITNTIWNDCSIWDVKSVIENPGAKKVWDPLFEESELVCSSSSTSSIWHTKRKGTWLLKAYDYVCFHSEYKTDHSIDLCSTSCPSNDTYHHKNLPQATSSYSRAKVDVDGTRLKKIDHQTVSFESVLLIQLPSSWLSLPPTSRSFVPQCSAIQQAKEYLETHGAPPSIQDIRCGLLIDTKYDHDSKNWRCEYTRHDTHTTSANEATRIHVRLDKRRWASAQNNQYSVVIDPPPSRFTAMEKNSDRFGIWLTIEHDESFIIPLCGKILVLIKPDDMFVENTDNPISINGISIPVEPPVEHVAVEEKHAFSSSYSENFLLDDLAEKKNVTLDKVWVMDHASTVFSFLKHTDEQFGWTVMSDNVKTGTRICKKSGTKNSNSNNNNNKNSNNSSHSNSNNNNNNNNGANSNINSKKKEEENENTVLKVPEPFMIYKATKVIENFSLDEVVSVVTDIDQIRRAYDDTIDNIELYRQVEPGCRIVRQSVKAIFPFKSRDLYTCTCLAQESSSLAMQPTKRTFYIESSLPNYPPVPDDNKKPLGHLFISGWILEPVDPYTTTTNHPIPSTRVCYVAALDLGQSVPSYISNLVANNWLPKKIQAVEGFLKSKNPPPYLVQPTSPLVFANNTLGSETEDGFELKETQTTYDRNNHVYRVVNQWSVSEPSTKKKKPNSNTNNGSSSSSTSNNNTKSEEGTIPFITHRRPSHGAVFTETIYRRGSLPSGILKKRIGPLSEKTPVSASKTVTCLECRIDLRSYPKGYEMTCHLWDMSEFKRDMTGKLTVLVTEPPLSNLINNSDGKKHYKHTVLITADITLSDAILELEFELMPAGEEAIQRRSTRLTVSGVLADEEDNNDWDGIMLMNSKELSLGKDTLLDYVQEYDIDREDDARPSILESEAFIEEPMPLDNQSKRDGDGDDKVGENDDDEDENEANSGGIQYIGGGVVATAIGNVSAGVNNLGARMMIPFRAASQTFLSKDESPKEETSVLSHPINNQSDTEGEGEGEEETEENGGNRSNNKNNSNTSGGGSGGDGGGGESKDFRDSTVTLHEVRVLRKSSETMKKGMLLMFICCGLSVVLALLLLQFMLERYYTSFTVSSTLSSLDESVEKGVVHRLIQIPWFGGWNIQLIAIRSNINR